MSNSIRKDSLQRKPTALQMISSHSTIKSIGIQVLIQAISRTKCQHRLWLFEAYVFPMAATDSMESSNLITCPTCDHSVSQNRGNKRIICPKCGNFYDRDSAVDELRQIRRVNREKQSPNEIKDRDEVMFHNLDYRYYRYKYHHRSMMPNKDIVFLKQCSFLYWSRNTVGKWSIL